jgi:site-specific DNA-cytosine methylase
LYHKSTVVNQDVNNGHLVVGSLAARDYKGVGNQYVNEGKVVVEAFTKGKRPQTSEHDRTYRQVTGALLGRDSFGPNHEGARDGKLILEQTEPVIGFSHTQGLSAQPSEAAWPTLRTEGNGMAVAYSIREDAKANTFSATELDRANALSALRPSPQSHHAQMFIAEGTQQSVNEVAGCLRSGGDGGVPSSRGEHLVVAYDEYNDTLGGEVHHALRAGTKQSTGVMTTMAVRRLTPLECERLMGWPDDWTAGQSDTHRYKQCGNGVASPVATWIAQQLLNIDK